MRSHTDNTYHEFDHAGKHYRLVYDELYATVGSYSYDTEEETKAAEDEEIEKLNSGEWVALGCIITRPCKGPHCEACEGKVEDDSLWGIVIENSRVKAEEYVKESM